MLFDLKNELRLPQGERSRALRPSHAAKSVDDAALRLSIERWQRSSAEYAPFYLEEASSSIEVELPFEAQVDCLRLGPPRGSESLPATESDHHDAPTTYACPRMDDSIPSWPTFYFSADELSSWSSSSSSSEGSETGDESDPTTFETCSTGSTGSSELSAGWGVAY